jgi:hypothetical protein
LPITKKIIDFEEIKAKKNKLCIFCDRNLLKPFFFRQQAICADCLKKIRTLYAEGYFEQEYESASLLNKRS